MALIEVSNVTKFYDEQCVLKDISISIEENKIYGLLGRNGVGKTTLLNMITNRIFPTQGEIKIGGENIYENDKILEKIYFMTEQNLYPKNMKVREIFKWTKEFYKNFDMEYALDLSKKFNLDINKKFKDLSTGYDSICKIIVTLASKAKILIFDEPVLGLDANHREIFYKEMMESYVEEPKTIIISTHIIDEVKNIIEKAIIIKDKNIMTSDDVESMINRAYTVSGLIENVDKYIENKRCLNIDTLAAFKSATIFGELSEEDKKFGAKLELVFSKVELQKLFIYLTEKGGKEYEEL